jgi:hypothetical protein
VAYPGFVGVHAAGRWRRSHVRDAERRTAECVLRDPADCRFQGASNAMSSEREAATWHTRAVDAIQIWPGVLGIQARHERAARKSNSIYEW